MRFFLFLKRTFDVVAVLYCSSDAFCLLNFAVERNSCALCECDDMSIPILYTHVHFTRAYTQMKASSRFFINTLKVCLKNRTLSLQRLPLSHNHLLVRSFVCCFIVQYLHRAEQKSSTRVWPNDNNNKKKTHKSPRSFVYSTTKYDISFFSVFSDLFILRSLFYTLSVFISFRALSLHHFVSFVSNAFLWDSWLQ